MYNVKEWAFDIPFPQIIYARIVDVMNDPRQSKLIRSKFYIMNEPKKIILWLTIIFLQQLHFYKVTIGASINVRKSSRK